MGDNSENNDRVARTMRKCCENNGENNRSLF